MDPGIVLLWVQIMLELAAAGEGLHEIGRRILAGENVTREELLAKQAETVTVVNRWDLAAPQDKDAPPAAEAAAGEPPHGDDSSG